MNQLNFITFFFKCYKSTLISRKYTLIYSSKKVSHRLINFLSIASRNTDKDKDKWFIQMGRRISILSTDAEILQIVPEEGFVEYLPFQISCFSDRRQVCRQDRLNSESERNNKIKCIKLNL